MGRETGFSVLYCTPFAHCVKSGFVVVNNDLKASRVEKFEVGVSDEAGYREDCIRLAIEAGHLLGGQRVSFYPQNV